MSDTPNMKPHNTISARPTRAALQAGAEFTQICEALTQDCPATPSNPFYVKLRPPPRMKGIGKCSESFMVVNQRIYFPHKKKLVKQPLIKSTQRCVSDIGIFKYTVYSRESRVPTTVKLCSFLSTLHFDMPAMCGGAAKKLN